MGWDEIKGQGRSVAVLRHLVRQGRLAHAYLFAGPAGVGKKMSALALASMLNCNESGDDFCGDCPSCRKIARGIHPDVQLVSVESGEKIKIEQVRKLQEEIAYKPFEGVCKVWIIDEAERMTPQAANCLLKTLEEPPRDSVLLLVSGRPEALLPTVVSRCQRVEFALLPSLVVKEVLRVRGVPEERLELAAALAEGSLEQSGLLESVSFWDWREEVLDYLVGPDGGEPRLVGLFALGDKIGKDKERIALFLRLSNLWHRDILLLKCGARQELVLNRDRIVFLRALAEKTPLGALRGALEAVQRAFSLLPFNANPRLVLEDALLEIKQV